MCYLYDVCASAICGVVERGAARVVVARGKVRTVLQLEREREGSEREREGEEERYIDTEKEGSERERGRGREIQRHRERESERERESIQEAGKKISSEREERKRERERERDGEKKNTQWRVSYQHLNALQVSFLGRDVQRREAHLVTGVQIQRRILDG
jgi:hypothetical protein